MSAETVFVSYVPEDAALAGRLKGDLVRAGVKVVDRASLMKPGFRLKAALKQAIESASYFVLCLSSRDGLPPAYARDEVAVAVAGGRSIIPVRFTRCDIPALDDSDAMGDLEAADLYDAWSAGVDRLTAVLPAASRENRAISGSSKLVVKAKRVRMGQLRGQATDVLFDVEDDMDVNGMTDLSAPK